MKKRTRRIVIAAGMPILLAAVIFAVKPSDRGAPHRPYYAALNAELKARVGRPVAVVDLDALDRNIALVKKNLKAPLKFRLVLKSLPSFNLMRYILERMGSNRLMVFHGPDLNYLAEQGAGDIDILLGKPMPLAEVIDFYAAYRRDRGFDPARQVQWLVDTPARLRQYLAFAKDKKVRMRISVEIDVGLHRGGVRSVQELDEVLGIVAANPAHLTFSGLMGYDVHAASAPSVIVSQRNAIQSAFAEVIDSYRALYDHGRNRYPALFTGDLTFNSGGSQTYMLFDGSGPVNDIALGSVLLKPSDFDAPLLEAHAPALFIAAPVLKRLDGTTIPFLEPLAGLFAWWNPNWQLSYFIYGGGWRASYLSPEGLVDNPIYGFSTNQAIVNGSAATALGVDDYIFFRPAQSEGIMREFGIILALRGGRIVESWGPLPQ